MQRAAEPLPQGHLPVLDGLRGAAILLVLGLHFTLYGGMQSEAPLDELFYRVAITGWVGVDLFFVLSGFLITRILLETKGSRSYFRAFYLRRSLRIFPLYYLTLVLFFVVLPRLAPPGLASELPTQHAAWYWTYLVNVRVALWSWSPAGLLEHFWSLSVEEQFYLFWPALVFCLTRKALLRFSLASLAVAALIRWGLIHFGHPVAAYVLTPARLDTLAVGGLVALLATHEAGLAHLRRWAGKAAGLAAIGLALVVVGRQGLEAEDPIVQVVGYPLLAVFFGALLAWIVTRPAASLPSRLFASRVLTIFGRYSYGLYVFHHPLVFFLQRQGMLVHSWPRIFGLELPSQVAFIFFATGLTLALALVSWHLWERRFLNLKRWFPYQPPAPSTFTSDVPVTSPRQPTV